MDFSFPHPGPINPRGLLRTFLGQAGSASLEGGGGGYCGVCGLCLYCFLSLLLPFCVSRCLCVWQGGVAGSWAAADEAHLRSIHSNHPLHKSLVVAPRRRRIIASSCYRHVLPYSALHPRRVQDLPASQHPAVPAGIYLYCSPCRSSRYLPLLLTLPFQPVSTSPAHPAVPAGIYLSCLNKLW